MARCVKGADGFGSAGVYSITGTLSFPTADSPALMRVVTVDCPRFYCAKKACRSQPPGRH